MEQRRVWKGNSVILATALLVEFCGGVEKHWLGNLEWRSARNWLNDSIPGLDSRVVFPVEMRHAVGMPRKADFRIAGLELPADGIVALPENGKLSISEEKESRGKISRWLWETPFFWVDPLNWNVSSEAVPHMERLPCQSDVVVLPGSSETFSMRLPVSYVPEVQAVRLDGDNITFRRWEWRHVTERAEFMNSGFRVRYSPLTACEDCPCQEGKLSDLNDYWEEICNIQRVRCGFPACEYPLKVEGHCCYYCGGRIRLSGKTLLSTTHRVAKSVLERYEKSVFWHSRITWDGHSEILITEKDAYVGTNTIIAITDLEIALKEEGVEVLYSETSGGPLYDYRLAVALGPFLGGFFVLLLLAFLLFPAFGYSHHQVWDAAREVGAAMCAETRVKGGRKKMSFSFARFENIFEGNVQLAEEEETASVAVTEASSSGSGGGERFENPLYGSEKHKEQLERQKLNLNEPVSLVALEKATKHDRLEEIEMDIETL